MQAYAKSRIDTPELVDLVAQAAGSNFDDAPTAMQGLEGAGTQQDRASKGKLNALLRPVWLACPNAQACPPWWLMAVCLVAKERSTVPLTRRTRDVLSLWSLLAGAM